MARVQDPGLKLKASDGLQVDSLPDQPFRVLPRDPDSVNWKPLGAHIVTEMQRPPEFLLERGKR